MKLKFTLIPLLSASAILPLVAAQCTQQKEETELKNPTQQPSTNPQSSTNGNGNQTTPGTVNGDNTGTNNNTEKEKPNTETNTNLLATVTANLKKVANVSTPTVTIVQALRDNLKQMEEVAKAKFPNEDDYPYFITEFLELAQNFTTNYTDKELDDSISRYPIHGSHGSAITKQKLVDKILKYVSLVTSNEGETE
ncbi:hypothetical protein ACM0IS_02790 [Mycoplasma aquilae ATCC BAA-1896]|uniref:hypothetical protein n=1 Tax=Mycoplasma aquilae TaxID=1312741 RepID=UPI003A874CA9